MPRYIKEIKRVKSVSRGRPRTRPGSKSTPSPRPKKDLKTVMESEFLSIPGCPLKAYSSPEYYTAIKDKFENQQVYTISVKDLADFVEDFSMHAIVDRDGRPEFEPHYVCVDVWLRKVCDHISALHLKKYELEIFLFSTRPVQCYLTKQIMDYKQSIISDVLEAVEYKGYIDSFKEDVPSKFKGFAFADRLKCMKAETVFENWEFGRFSAEHKRLIFWHTVCAEMISKVYKGRFQNDSGEELQPPTVDLIRYVIFWLKSSDIHGKPSDCMRWREWKNGYHEKCKVLDTTKV